MEQESNEDQQNSVNFSLDNNNGELPPRLLSAQ
jgi:hypothetical protein